MSNQGRMPAQGRQRGLPEPPKGDPIAAYDTYLDAQRAVDFLSDNHFPVQFVTIVGSDLRMVERVTGRLTYARVALASGLNGAWFGGIVGVLLWGFGNASSGVVIASMLVGAAAAIFAGLLSYSFTGGDRDFTSTSQIVAREYEVLCLTDHVQDALELLGRLPGGTGRRPSSLRRADPVELPVQDVPPMPVTGPTYGEMIDRQRDERLAREAAERAERERRSGEQRHGGTA